MIGVDQLLGGRRRFGEDAEPREGIDSLEDGERIERNGGAGDPVEAVATGDEVAVEFMLLTVLAVANARPDAVDAVEARGFGLKQNLAAGGEAGGNQILDHLLLGVDGDGAAGELLKVDAMGAAGEAQLDAAMGQSFALDAIPDAGALHKLYRVVFEDARAHAVLDVMTRVGLEHHGFDAFEMQQM